MSYNYADCLDEFEACEIDPTKFDHHDHVGFAYELLDKYDFLNACAKYANSIRTMAVNAGAETKFNTTITLAFLSVIAERKQSTHAYDFDAFITLNEDLLTGNVLAKWYSSDRLKSDLARNMFLMPDLAA